MKAEIPVLATRAADVVLHTPEHRHGQVSVADHGLAEPGVVSDVHQPTGAIGHLGPA